jgi:hypothetical protein
MHEVFVGGIEGVINLEILGSGGKDAGDHNVVVEDGRMAIALDREDGISEAREIGTNPALKESTHTAASVDSIATLAKHTGTAVPSGTALRKDAVASLTWGGAVPAGGGDAGCAATKATPDKLARCTATDRRLPKDTRTARPKYSDASGAINAVAAAVVDASDAGGESTAGYAVHTI